MRCDCERYELKNAAAIIVPEEGKVAEHAKDACILTMKTPGTDSETRKRIFPDDDEAFPSQETTYMKEPPYFLRGATVRILSKVIVIILLCVACWKRVSVPIAIMSVVLIADLIGEELRR